MARFPFRVEFSRKNSDIVPLFSLSVNPVGREKSSRQTAQKQAVGESWDERGCVSPAAV